MKVIEIGFVGYPVTDLARARGFYEGILGLKQTRAFEEEGFAWVEYDIGPGTLAIATGMPDWKPASQGGCAGLEVDDFDAAVSHLKQKGVEFVQGPMETPVCHMGVVLDPDGNLIAIHKRKEPGWV